MASDSEVSTHSDPNFAVICSFLEIFGESCALESPSISHLIEMLDNTQEVGGPLKDLHVKLLRRAVKSFHADRWEKCLVKFCHQCGHHQDAWELERFGYKKASSHIKLRVLKNLLEYQFSCNTKFKTGVNKRESKELRLNPVGRDVKGRCYWMHTDYRANIRLYMEDQDEETWKLIASDANSLSEVIAALKSGNSPCDSVSEPILNEDSNSVGSTSSLLPANNKDNELKVASSSPLPLKGLNPESVKDETESADIPVPIDKNLKSNLCALEIKSCDSDNSVSKPTTAQLSNHNSPKDKELKSSPTSKQSEDPLSLTKASEKADCASSSEDETASIPSIAESNIIKSNQISGSEQIDDNCHFTTIHKTNEKLKTKCEDLTEDSTYVSPLKRFKNEEKTCPEVSDILILNSKTALDEMTSNDDSEVIEEKVMLITGTGEGAPCDSCPPNFFGEEITEDVMYFWGQGEGRECDTGNPGDPPPPVPSPAESDSPPEPPPPSKSPSKSNSGSESENHENSKTVNGADSNCRVDLEKQMTHEISLVEEKPEDESSEPSGEPEQEGQKTMVAAPLPVTKRFLQNIPKPGLCANADSDSSLSKARLWSIDSLCNKASSSVFSDPTATEKNNQQIASNAVLTNNSPINENNPLVFVNNSLMSSENTHSEKTNSAMTDDSHVAAEIIESTNCDNSAASSAPEIQKDIISPKKFFFGRPDCLKLSPNSIIPTITPPITITSVNIAPFTTSQQQKNIQPENFTVGVKTNLERKSLGEETKSIEPSKKQTDHNQDSGEAVNQNDEIGTDTTCGSDKVPTSPSFEPAECTTSYSVIPELTGFATSTASSVIPKLSTITADISGSTTRANVSATSGSLIIADISTVIAKSDIETTATFLSITPVIAASLPDAAKSTIIQTTIASVIPILDPSVVSDAITPVPIIPIPFISTSDTEKEFVKVEQVKKPSQDEKISSPTSVSIENEISCTKFDAKYRLNPIPEDNVEIKKVVDYATPRKFELKDNLIACGSEDKEKVIKDTTSPEKSETKDKAKEDNDNVIEFIKDVTLKVSEYQEKVSEIVENTIPKESEFEYKVKEIREPKESEYRDNVNETFEVLIPKESESEDKVNKLVEVAASKECNDKNELIVKDTTPEDKIKLIQNVVNEEPENTVIEDITPKGSFLNVIEDKTSKAIDDNEKNIEYTVPKVSEGKDDSKIALFKDMTPKEFDCRDKAIKDTIPKESTSNDEVIKDLAHRSDDEVFEDTTFNESDGEDKIIEAVPTINKDKITEVIEDVASQEFVNINKVHIVEDAAPKESDNKDAMSEIIENAKIIESKDKDEITEIEEDKGKVNKIAEGAIRNESGVKVSDIAEDTSKKSEDIDKVSKINKDATPKVTEVSKDTTAKENDELKSNNLKNIIKDDCSKNNKKLDEPIKDEVKTVTKLDPLKSITLIAQSQNVRTPDDKNTIPLNDPKPSGKHKADEIDDIDKLPTSDDSVSIEPSKVLAIKKPKLSNDNSIEEDNFPVLQIVPESPDIKVEEKSSSPPQYRKKISHEKSSIKDIANAIDAISSRIIDKKVNQKTLMTDPDSDDSGIRLKKIKVENEEVVLNADVQIENSKKKPIKVANRKSERSESKLVKNNDLEVTPKLNLITEKSELNHKTNNSDSNESDGQLQSESTETSVTKGRKNRRTESPKSMDDPLEVKMKKSKTINLPRTTRKRGAVSIKHPSDSEDKPSKAGRKRSHEETESPSEEDYIDGQKSKRLKIKPKVTNTKHRKKVEEKKKVEDSSSDEEIVAPLPKGKIKKTPSAKKHEKVSPMSTKKALGQKKSKSKSEQNPLALEEDDETPVRQSRRIAQLKIKEEAQRRMMEEVALRELKAKHKKKEPGDKSEPEWHHSSSENSSDSPLVKGRKGRGKGKKNKKVKKPSDWNFSSGPSDSDSEPEDDIEDHEVEEEIITLKSDHEFSPESDIDSEDVAPTRHARTLKKEEGTMADVNCSSCGRGDHPEWILLCDACDSGWHASCLKPVLFLVPEGNWFCPPCNHKKLVTALEERLVEHEKLLEVVQIEDLKKKKPGSTQSIDKVGKSNTESSENSDESSSGSSSSSEDSDDAKIYRLRERRQLPVSYHFKEYDQLISSAIKEEYKEVDSSGAGNQGRGKDISTIIEADKEEKKAMLQESLKMGGSEADDDAIQKNRRRVAVRSRRKPRKLNSLEVISDDCDDNSDEDFKETGWSTSSSEVGGSESEVSKDSSRSSDSLPIRRSQRSTHSKKSRKKCIESPEHNKKRKKPHDDGTTSESSGARNWSSSRKSKSPVKKSLFRSSNKKSKKKKKTKRTEEEKAADKAKYGQGRAKIKYGGLSDSSRESHDWSPAHRTRQRRVNYLELPNTDSEDEAHKPSGKHMDSSDEYKGESDSNSDSEASKGKKKSDDESASLPTSQVESSPEKLLSVTVKKDSDLLMTSLQPVVKLANISHLKVALTDSASLDVPATVQALASTVLAPTLASTVPSPARGKGFRGSRGNRGSRNQGSLRKVSKGRGRGGVGEEQPPPRESRPRLAANISPIKDGEDDLPSDMKLGDFSDNLSELENISDLDHEDLDDLTSSPVKIISMTPFQMEKEKKRKEREEKLLEKEKKKEERIKKKEEKQQEKEQKAKEREDKKQAKIAEKEQNKNKRKQMPPEFMGGGPMMNSNIGPRPGLLMAEGPPRGMMQSHSQAMRPLGHPTHPGHPGHLGHPGHPSHPSHPGHPGHPGLESDMAVHHRLKLEHSGYPPGHPLDHRGPAMPPERWDPAFNYRRPDHPPERRDGEDRRGPPPSGPPGPLDPRVHSYPGVPPGYRPHLTDNRPLLDPSRRLPPGYALDARGNPVMLDPRARDPRAIMEEHARASRPIVTDPRDRREPYAPDGREGVPGVPRPPSAESGDPEGLSGASRSSTPKRRGRGPGKKTLARQTASNPGTPGTADGNSHSPNSSNSSIPEGTLAVAGAPQPFRPTADVPSVITRMPHMMPPPYRGSSMYSSSGPLYGPPRGPPGHMSMSGMYRPHPPHPLDPSPSGGGPISMASPGRNSPHDQPYPPYPGAPFYPPGPYPGRFPPHLLNPAAQPRPDSDADDKRKVPRESLPFLRRPEIKQEPLPAPIERSLSPCEDKSPSNDESNEDPASDDNLQNSSAPSSPPPARAAGHPQLKHTESKLERTARGRIALTTAARYPQGPYAPQYGPYAPYPPPTSEGSYGGHLHPPPAHPLGHRPPHHPSPLHRPPHLSSPHLSSPHLSSPHPPSHLSSSHPPPHLSSPHPPPQLSSPHPPPHLSSPHPPPQLSSPHPPPHLSSSHPLPTAASPHGQRSAAPQVPSTLPLQPTREPLSLRGGLPGPLSGRPPSGPSAQLSSPPPRASGILRPPLQGPGLSPGVSANHPGPPSHHPGMPSHPGLPPVTGPPPSASASRHPGPHQSGPPQQTGHHSEDEVGEFGGLVSYFSSQHEDDIDS